MNKALVGHAGVSHRISQRMSSAAADVAIQAVTTAEAATYAQAYTYAALAYSVMAATWALAEVAYAIQEGGRSNRKN